MNQNSLRAALTLRAAPLRGLFKMLVHFVIRCRSP